MNFARHPLFSLVVMAMILTVFLPLSASAQKPKGPSHTPPTEKCSKSKEEPDVLVDCGKKPIQFSKEERDEMRGKLQELADTIKLAADDINPGDTETAEAITKVKDQIAGFTDDELDAFRSTLDPSTMGNGLKKVQATLKDFRPDFKSYYLAMKSHASAMSPTATDFPELASPTVACNALIGSKRPTEILITAADLLYLIAEGVHALAGRACNQVAVAVILGNGGGGNGSLACTAADILLALAKGIRETLRSCDEGYTKRSVETALQRLEYLHNQMDANKVAIVGEITSSKTAIVLNANQNADALTATMNGIQKSIIDNDNTNAALLLRSQIEADLQSPDNAIPLAMFETPSSKGGLLDLVRKYVVLTITNLAGSSTSQANSFLAQGDKYRDALNFKAAYASYRQAYKSAAK